jgi:hypothetical protein
MRRLCTALLFTGVACGAQAQTASENYSYKAPSGMFSEGTTKWQMFQFMASDAEKIAKLRAGPTATTGSLSTSSSDEESYARPGEAQRSPRRRTAN